MGLASCAIQSGVAKMSCSVCGTTDDTDEPLLLEPSSLLTFIGGPRIDWWTQRVPLRPLSISTPVRLKTGVISEDVGKHQKSARSAGIVGYIRCISLEQTSRRLS